MKKVIHIMNLKTHKTVRATVLLFILYSIGVHVESPKYKMICQNSPKSSAFLTNSDTILKIGKIKIKLHLQWDSNPQYLRFEATEHPCNRMLIEHCQTRI